MRINAPIAIWAAGYIWLSISRAALTCPAKAQAHAGAETSVSGATTASQPRPAAMARLLAQKTDAERKLQAEVKSL